MTPPDRAKLIEAIDALMADPRGRWRPQTLALGELGGGDARRLVMQVGVDAQGRLCVVTDTPLEAGVRYVIDPVPPADAAPGVYAVHIARPGHRPEDASTPCWINVLEAIGPEPDDGGG